ncbi:MAG: hypothetical protein A3B70_04090 [Deltaproteobacteria bacterium RIFCSPHIGHO2_02_FULL_40_11]|nr:MAG: hypothetical protein A3B70_04090 [Deltaproteobacteria bacterium RIFCSPHIGHO2_02_FULL_40_11]
MKIKLKFFAYYETLFQKDEMEVEISEHTTVRDVFFKVLHKNPHAHQLFKNTMFAVNQSYVQSATKLNSDDELAFIPPVAGG